MTPIGICSKNEKCLPVLLKSIELYVPEDVEVFITSPNKQFLPKHKVHHFVHTYETCGAAHNFIAHKIFETHDSFVSIDDDVVLNPNTYSVLMDDVNELKSMGFKLGAVAGRTNYAKGFQNIRTGSGKLTALTYESEGFIVETDYLAGILAWVQKSTWVSLAPIDWFLMMLRARNIWKTSLDCLYPAHISIMLDRKHLELTLPSVQKIQKTGCAKIDQICMKNTLGLRIDLTHMHLTGLVLKEFQHENTRMAA